MSAALAQKKLASFGSPAAAKLALRFFKTGPEQYGAGDLFIGVKAAPLRQLAKEFRQLPLSEIQILLDSPIHEERSLALSILALQFPRSTPIEQKGIYNFYLTHTRQINNWDLVDVSAPAIVGGYLFPRSRKDLVRLAESASLWERRIAIVATQHFIRKDDFADTVKISRLLLQDKEDLIHKAAGWMLREVGDRDLATLEAFLAEHGPVMPRTMLRYAIEKFPEVKRKALLLAFPPAKRSRK